MIMFGCLVIVFGLAAVLKMLENGSFVEHAIAAASHHVSGAALAMIGDIFLY